MMQNQFFQKTNDGKQLLRDMMAHHIPNSITKAEKQGFSSPDASWFKGESIGLVRDTLFNSNAQIYDVLDRKAVTPLIEQHLNGEQNRRLFIWSLLSIENYFYKWS